jgi:hypothetical protein
MTPPRFLKLLGAALLALISNVVIANASHVTDIQVKPYGHKSGNDILSLQYTDKVRLSKPLTYVVEQLDYTPYFLGSSLIDLSQTEALAETQKSIIKRLTAINTKASLQIANQLKTLLFAPKVIADLDLDKIKISPKKDPLLSGEFVLHLPKRPNTLLFVGALNTDSAIKVTITLGSTLNDYLNRFPQLSSSQKSAPWIIQADQSTHQANNVYWKGKPTYLSPGAIIFIGLDDLPEKDKDLNKAIVNLLSNRVEW